MKVITKEHDLDFFKSNIFEIYFNSTNMAIFDIETLGLNSNYNQVVLASIFSVTPQGKGTVNQYFIEDLNEEELLLTTIKDELNKYETIITYNGKNFDLPFILNRARKLGLKNYNILPFNLDLYLLVRATSDLRERLKSLKQKSIEEYMGVAVHREDEISGKESVDLYYEYIGEDNPSKKQLLLNKILLHNHDDVVQLYKILGITANLDFHYLMGKLGFKIKGLADWGDFVISNIKISNQRLICVGEYQGEPTNFVVFEDNNHNYFIELFRDRKFMLSCPLFNLKGSLFINLKSYFKNIDEFNHLSGYVNGFLILCDKNKQINHLEANTVVRHLLFKFMEENAPIK